MRNYVKAFFKEISLPQRITSLPDQKITIGILLYKTKVIGHWWCPWKKMERIKSEVIAPYSCDTYKNVWGEWCYDPYIRHRNYILDTEICELKMKAQEWIATNYN